MRRFLLATIVCMACFTIAAQNPKREFRGAWIQAVNGQWQGIGRDAMQAELTRELDTLQADGINAILFQCRVEGDALYQSDIEPWSRYLTGQQGTPPSPYWDPLAWMVEQCHARGMEIHAWINPFRAKTKGTKEAASTHICAQHPERCFEYDNMLIMDPGLPENREYICKVTADIVERYDIDGLHIDDYFYPYPVNGKPIPDEATYRKYGAGMELTDWRRANVNQFMRELFEAIRITKPWVKFGVSPFGIYRNRSSWSDGSNTSGLQNYDNLYADVLLWINEGIIDYNIPQIYWEIGNKAADYETLIRWWNDHAGQRPLYIGQDVERTVAKPDKVNPNTHQMVTKYTWQRSLPAVFGSCQWYARAVVDNKGQYGSILRHYYHNTPALQPSMPWIDKNRPGKPRKLAVVQTSLGPRLFWTAPKTGRKPLQKIMDSARQFVVYRFGPDEKVNLESTNNIIAITNDNNIPLPERVGNTKYTYVVTALDRLHNESKGAKIKIKL
ncbi:MAG: family 10 glycosylhydrolase [Bacteroidaceae bacterium]|nr:family 10 glycosylhydrolase [Bacteroidaceae bacterium]